MEFNCIDCDYILSEANFYSGTGRAMFSCSAGKYRCGFCDDRGDEEGKLKKIKKEKKEQESDGIN
jgi:hypothetical protein